MRDNKLFFTAITVLLFYCGCASVKLVPTPPVTTLPVTAIKSGTLLKSAYLVKKNIDPAAGESAVIEFEPVVKCSADIDIIDDFGRVVKTLKNNETVSASLQNAVWDGKDSTGQAVPGGVYFYIIRLRTSGGRIYTYNPYNETQGLNFTLTTCWYDAEKQQIRYKLPRAAMVKIRVGLQDGGPLLSTPLDWIPQTSGEHILKWDGKDSSGNIELAGHPKRALVLFAYALADNSIIVKGGDGSSDNGGKLLSADLALDRNIHSRHDPRFCHEPKISLEFLGSKSENGVPVLTAKASVKVSIDPRDWPAMENSRYEIMLFVDTVFLFEDEAAFTPFGYQLDTAGLLEGEHLLTVNLVSYDDHCGIITQKVLIKK